MSLRHPIASRDAMRMEPSLHPPDEPREDESFEIGAEILRCERLIYGLPNGLREVATILLTITHELHDRVDALERTKPNQ